MTEGQDMRGTRSLRSSGAGRLRRLAGATGAAAAATALAVAAIGGSTALLGDRTALPGSTIASGTAALRVNGSQAAGVTELSPTPAAPEVRVLSLANYGAVPLSVSGRFEVATRPELLAHVLVRMTAVAAEADCVPGLDGPQGPIDGYVVPPLGTVTQVKGLIACLEIGLAADTPPQLSGQRVSFKATLEGIQVEG